ncbi:hypothetical protein BN1048_00236 [Jeotgalicoccus saudimassiliensis]|uniref:DUF4352 domain-containing protein n=1 Tax=Jeotgalicoccus saudimassiliensis TaxID=1461582 RepID=A0A078LYK7_9STAP|nr:DUF4352 domain-containing protein [Jeotgalicoccus saudimassiliensis]CDZ99114.1 hypothetical protein BN1048_00236 [Jeotgalicoccus saudimassiliensis]
MKKILITFLSALFVLVLAACGSEETNEGSEEGTDDTETEESGDNSSSGDFHEGAFDIGETINIQTFPSKQPVELTVNDLQLTTEVEGKSIEDYISNPLPEQRLLVADVTITNNGEESIIPVSELPTTKQEDGSGNDGAKTDLFTEFEQPVEPGDEISGTLVFTTSTSNSYDTISMNIKDGLEGHVFVEIPGINAE